uniref:Uncharacterized protein n=1 Tax=Arundo donax TaxID=35708 RepID=A0A0A9B0Z1_ARUDO
MLILSRNLGLVVIDFGHALLCILLGHFRFNEQNFTFF